MKFPVFSQLAGNLAAETSSLKTAPSSGESGANVSLAGIRLPASRSRGSALFAAIDLDGNGLEQPLKLGDVQVLERP